MMAGMIRGSYELLNVPAVAGLWFHVRIVGTTEILYLPSSYSSLSLVGWAGWGKRAGLLLQMYHFQHKAVYLEGL